jgi:uncharacterized delta-60 repeat protein
MYNVLIQPDGKYLVSGQSLMNGNNDFAVIRLDPDGTLDSTFSQTGIFTIDVSGQSKEDFGYGLALQPDGKLILSGNTEYNEANDERYSMIRLIAKEVLARFSANPTLICAGQQVSYTNQSLGSNLTYNWIFEGGTPSTSTAQNPTITYNNPGIFDTWLIVTNGSATDTLIKSELIEVRAVPAPPATPAGPQELCGTEQAEYTTHQVDYADTYNWIVTPAAAGTLAGTDTTVIFTASSNYSGAYTIKAQGVGLCGTGPWSAGLSCQLNLMPTIYSLTGEGEYCSGEEGAVLILSGSETGTDYELYLDGDPTGLIQGGTGAPLTWNDISEEGVYTVFGYTESCNNQMSEQVIVTAITAPDPPEAPEGTSKACAGGTDTYSVTEVASATSYTWQIDPANAGVANGNEAATEITWNQSFSGPVDLTVIAANSCGESPVSAALAITVEITPSPEVSGPEELCQGWTAEYQVTALSGSSYVWTVQGGSIVSGAGTAQISVLWNTAGTGSVVVEETTQQGCNASSAALPVLVNPCTGLEESGTMKAMTVQPNPFRTGLNIHLSGESGPNAVLRIYDVTGTILAEQRVEDGQKALTVPDLDNAAPGIYFIRLSSSSQPAKMIRVIKM